MNYQNPGRRHLHNAKWRRFVRAVQRRGGAYSPYAVATARLGPSKLKNPASPKQRRLAKMAVSIAKRLYAHFKKNGVPGFVLKRVPKPIRPTVLHLLKYNGVPVRNPPDKTSAHELFLYMQNDGGLYQKRVAIEKNLATKLHKGVFRKHLAAKLFMYWVEEGAKKYAREFASPGEWKIIFPKRTRLRVARHFTRRFLTEAKLGNYVG